MVRNGSKPSGKTNTRRFCPRSEWLNVYKLIVKSCLTLIFHKEIQSVCHTNSFLECHFQIVCKRLRHVTSAQTACALVFNLRNQSWVNTALVCLIPWAKLRRSSFTHTDTHLEHSRHGRWSLISCTCCGGGSVSPHSVSNTTSTWLRRERSAASVCMEMSGFHQVAKCF